MFIPKCSQEFSLNILAHDLNQTKDCGLVLNPNSDVCKVDAYLDADFYGIDGNKEPTDSACVKSRTGFIITSTGCPVFWVSRLHT